MHDRHQGGAGLAPAGTPLKVKTAAYLLAGLLGLGGLIFLIAAGQSNVAPRVIIGIVLLGAALFFIFLARSKAPKIELVQRIDLSGDVSVEEMRCQACGATLDSDSVKVEAGAIFVSCPYCGTSYQLEEEPKW